MGSPEVQFHSGISHLSLDTLVLFPGIWTAAANNYLLLLGYPLFPIAPRSNIARLIRPPTSTGRPNVLSCGGHEKTHERARLPTAGMVVGVGKKNTHTQAPVRPRVPRSRISDPRCQPLPLPPERC